MCVEKLVICVNANDFSILEKSFNFTYLIPEWKCLLRYVNASEIIETHLPFPPTFFLFSGEG